MMSLITRRSLITSLVSLVAAPAIVRASSLMPVKAWADYATLEDGGFIGSGLRFNRSQYRFGDIIFLPPGHTETISVELVEGPIGGDGYSIHSNSIVWRD